MFRRILAPACLALVALTSAMAGAASASGVHLGSFVVNNDSNVAINYTVVWSDGDVEYFTIQPGTRTAHFTELDANGQIPTPTVVFDSVGGDSTFQAATYELTAYAVNDPMAGKAYSFVYSANGVNLDLYAG
jgi:hypothetical protein